MKYIRTKCGKIVKHPHPNADVFTFRYEIERQADTIEELCDELVLIRKDLHLNERTVNFEYAKGMAKQGFIVYGAIWTDKGLIYVAKMNDKGELELL